MFLEGYFRAASHFRMLLHGYCLFLGDISWILFVYEGYSIWSGLVRPRPFPQQIRNQARTEKRLSTSPRSGIDLAFSDPLFVLAFAEIPRLVEQIGEIEVDDLLPL